MPIKLLVVDDYKGFGRRYFFSTNVNAAVISFYLDYRALPKEKSHNCWLTILPRTS